MMTEFPSARMRQFGLALRNEAATASAVRGDPSWNLMSWRKLKVQRWLPGSACQDAASAGWMRPCSVGYDESVEQ